MTIHIKQTEINSASLIALHSSAASGSQWKQLSEDFAGNFLVQSPKLPGYKNAMAGRDHSQSGINTVAMPLVRQIKAAGKPVHLIGHSFGGAVALNIALAIPEMIRSLVIYEPVAFHILAQLATEDENRLAFAEIRQLAGLSTAAIASGDDFKAMQMFIDYWNGSGSWDRLPAKAKANLAGQAGIVASDFAAAFSETWTLDALSELTIPTLVMMGLNSPTPAQQVSIKISNAMPTARLAMLPELGHMAPITHPEWINPRIREHLVRTERPATSVQWPLPLAA